jgi:putative photosynthetic complex assembly protein
MSDAGHERTLPRGALVGAGLLIAAAILATGAARLTGVGTTQLPAAAPVVDAELRFLDREDGAIAVERHPDGATVAVLPPGSNGFARGVLRGLARDRHLQNVGAGPPFRLVRWSDGRLSLEDPVTQRRIALEAFGPANAQVFADLLTNAQQDNAGGT